MKKIDFKKAIQESTQSMPLSLLETEERIRKQLIIIDEIRDYIHPLSDDEFLGLEKTLLEEGINDPLIIWETTPKIAGIGNDENPIYVLIDGHHRYKISQKHNLPFAIVLKNYPTLEAAKTAMLDKQIYRRNLTPEQVAYYRGLKYNFLKSKQIGVEKIQNIAQELSKEFGVSEKTIRRDGDFATGINKLSPTLKKQVLNREINLPKTAIGIIAKLDDVSAVDDIEKIDKIVKNLNKYSDATEANAAELKEKVREMANADFGKMACKEMIDLLNKLLVLL